MSQLVFTRVEFVYKLLQRLVNILKTRGMDSCWLFRKFRGWLIGCTDISCEQCVLVVILEQNEFSSLVWQVRCTNKSILCWLLALFISVWYLVGENSFGHHHHHHHRHLRVLFTPEAVSCFLASNGCDHSPDLYFLERAFLFQLFFSLLLFLRLLCRENYCVHSIVHLDTSCCPLSEKNRWKQFFPCVTNTTSREGTIDKKCW